MKKHFLLLAVIILGSILRLFHLGTNPPSLSWDEASLGYNAFTIAQNGRDEHGEFMPLARFTAFGDYKPPGYIYAAAVPVKLIGLNEVSVRLPSAVAGIVMIILTYLLVKEMFGKTVPALLTSFMIAVSPWDLHLARAAYEAHLAALFNLAGVYFFLRSEKKGYAYLLSVIAFVLSFYTFNANRIIAPVLLFSLSLLRYRRIISNSKWVLVSVVLAVCMLLPSVSYLRSPESKLRFQEVSIFNNLEPLRLSNTRIENDSGSLFGKVIHNRRVVYFLDYLKHYSENFEGTFLFAQGDVNPRIAVRDMGQLYFIDLPLVIAGLLFLQKFAKRQFFIIALWMLVAAIPAGFAKETPHALRTVSVLPSYQILSALGLYFLLRLVKERKILPGSVLISVVLAAAVFAGNIYYYLHNYYIHFPRDWSGEWQYGYKQMVEYVSSKESTYRNIYVTSALGRPYIYFAFYQSFPPDEFLRQRVARRDSFGFWDVYVLGHISFTVPDDSQIPPGSLVVTTGDNRMTGMQYQKTIMDLAGKPVFVIGEKL